MFSFRTNTNEMKYNSGFHWHSFHNLAYFLYFTHLPYEEMVAQKYEWEWNSMGFISLS